jgi:hypothetical protein
MARVLVNGKCTAVCARTGALQDGTLVDTDLNDLERLLVETKCLCVGNGGLDELGKDGSGALGAVLELDQRTINGLSTNEAGNKTHLAGCLSISGQFCGCGRHDEK